MVDGAHWFGVLDLAKALIVVITFLNTVPLKKKRNEHKEVTDTNNVAVWSICIK